MSDDSQARQKKFFSEISRAVPFPSGPHNENKEKPLVLLTAEDFVSVNNTATFVEKYVRTSTKSKHIHLVEEKKSELPTKKNAYTSVLILQACRFFSEKPELLIFA